MTNKLRMLGATLGVLAAFPLFANEEAAEHNSDSIALNYVGDDVRIGIGYSTETDLTGEFFWTFSESAEAAWIAEGWLGDGGAGGVKLNYHWLADGVEAGQDINGDTVYSDGSVRKLFIAADRNAFDDSKVTFGGGGEKNDHFWSVYGSRATSGERFIGQSIDIDELFVTGVADNHAFRRTDTLETITDFYAHPYDWGVGFHLGRHFPNSLFRVRGGFDYERGDYNSSQSTIFASLDKRFTGSSHGLSLRAEVLRKHGEFEIDKSDVRLGAFWTFDFGSSFQPAAVYRDVQVERIPDPSELPRKEVVEVVRNQVTMDNTASFSLNSDNLGSAAKSALDSFIASLSSTRVAGDIRIVGHTCSLGTDAYNQGLSERRAAAVRDYLVKAGVDASILKSEGRGEHEPRFSNDAEESRTRNRRVEIFFTAEEEVTREIIVGEGEPITEWVQEKVPVEAAWIRRALRNPVTHKRSVDYYRINKVTERMTKGPTDYDNTAPGAADDVFEVAQDSVDQVLNVLANDSDPEGDALTIVSVGTPSHGVAVVTGNAITYTPDDGYYGSDSFSYMVEDGYGGTDSAVVNINVARANINPAAENDQFTVVEDSSSNALNVLANDSDADGDSLTIVSVTTPMHGTASISGDMVIYTPNPGYFGMDSFDYTVDDGFGGQATATISLTVEEFNNPPVAVDDSKSTYKERPVVIEVLANDYDLDGDPLTIVEIIQDDHPMGHVVDNGDGTLTYTPMSNWWGGDAFQYRISDGRGGTALATVRIVVVYYGP